MLSRHFGGGKFAHEFVADEDQTHIWDDVKEVGADAKVTAADSDSLEEVDGLDAFLGADAGHLIHLDTEEWVSYDHGGNLGNRGDGQSLEKGLEEKEKNVFWSVYEKKNCRLL